jgi:hypothetical protein
LQFELEDIRGELSAKEQDVGELVEKATQAGAQARAERAKSEQLGGENDALRAQLQVKRSFFSRAVRREGGVGSVPGLPAGLFSRRTQDTNTGRGSVLHRNGRVLQRRVETRTRLISARSQCPVLAAGCSLLAARWCVRSGSGVWCNGVARRARLCLCTLVHACARLCTLVHARVWAGGGVSHNNGRDVVRPSRVLAGERAGFGFPLYARKTRL